tara:strand:+ start:6364 stop:6819 length:456 start_codon:yes stop_codon:yes gene_type:complete
MPKLEGIKALSIFVTPETITLFFILLVVIAFYIRRRKINKKVRNKNQVVMAKIISMDFAPMQPRARRIKIRYEFNGKVHDQDTMIHRRLLDFNFEKRYDVGSEVKIYIDPDDPTYFVNDHHVDNISSPSWRVGLIIFAILIITLVVKLYGH